MADAGLLPQDRLRSQAQAAARLWGGDPASLEHIADSANAVYHLPGLGYLRLTRPQHRSREACLAELDFLRHLLRSGVPVAAPLPSQQGLELEQLESPDGLLQVTVFEPARGDFVAPDSEHWNESFFRSWGAWLAKLHQAARSFRPGAARRWHWRDEPLLRAAPALIPHAEMACRRELDLLLAALDAVPETRRGFGMIHADCAPVNFRYLPETGITGFDFGNCCRHFFAMDLAVGLSVLSRRPERDAIRTALLAGYQEYGPDLPELALLESLLRLRVVYVYLTRLAAFGPQPNERQKRRLAALSARVREQRGW